MAGIEEKTTIATGEATTPPGVVPTALSSQQSQALGKAKVDLSSVQAAVERSEREIDKTVYPDSQKKSGPPESTPAGGAAGGAGPSTPPIPSAVTTQQSQALSKARVDLGAMASAIQGAMVQPPASPASVRAGEKDLTAVPREEGALAQPRLHRGTDAPGAKSGDVVPSTPAFDAYVADLRRSAEEPFPDVAEVPLDEAASNARTRPEAAPPGAVDTADRTAPTQRRASSKPDYVAAPIRVGPPRRGGAVAPLGGGAAQGAASLGVPAPRESAALAGDRAMVGSIDAPVPMADKMRDAEHCDPRERAERLLHQARELRGSAAPAAESLQLARAHRAEAEARHLEGLAMRATVEAQAVADADAVLHMQAQREAELETMLASRAASLDPDGLLSDPRRVTRVTHG